MIALRQIVKSNSGKISINLPTEYQEQTLEIIILPLHENKIKTPSELAKAHEIIKNGCPDVDQSFIENFENNLQERVLPRI